MLLMLPAEDAALELDSTDGRRESGNGLFRFFVVPGCSSSLCLPVHILISPLLLDQEQEQGKMNGSKTQEQEERGSKQGSCRQIAHVTKRRARGSVSKSE
mmetsp:Transcript_54283/g.87889  ORF Transcript_54283/g.87889 Transcript_54283/m.87889 type:complete len:100 (+) Transcript_54283:693-992(+)